LEPKAASVAVPDPNPITLSVASRIQIPEVQFSETRFRLSAIINFASDFLPASKRSKNEIKQQQQKKQKKRVLENV